MDIAGSLGKMEDKEKTLLPWRMEEKEEALLPLRMQALGLSDREQVDGGLEEPKMQEGAGAASTEGANSPRGEMGSEEAYVGIPPRSCLQRASENSTREALFSFPSFVLARPGWAPN